MPLLNAFVDSFVCVGFSSERGVTLDPESKSNGSLFTSSLQPSVLAIVTSDYAVYPQLHGYQFVDPLYPPSDRSTSQTSTVSSMKTSKQQSIPAVYTNLPLFCFPDGAQATLERENERIHHVVFTQEDGKRTYAVVITFQQPFMLKSNRPDDDGVYQVVDVQRTTVRPRQPSISRIPIAIDKRKTVSSTSTTPTNLSPVPATPTTTSKSRSRKMPSSFQVHEPAASTRSRSSSNDNTNRHHYATPTLSSYMKNLSSVAAPPPGRLSRTNSQSNTTPANEPTTPTAPSTARPRSNSNAFQKLPLNTAPSARSSSRTPSGIPTPSSRSIAASVPLDISKPLYLPHCIVLVSAHPYWTEMQETITLVHDEMTQAKIEPSADAYKLLIQKYAFLACNTPVPPIPWERFSLSFSLPNQHSVLMFDPPIDSNRTVLDLDLSTLLLTLNIGKLLDVLAAILSQQPIIFFSSNYSKLVTTLECLLYLIYPLKWINIYVPLVPYGLRDHYLEGPPGSYIMGTHSRHQEIVEQIDSSLTCNLDNDKNIYVPKTIDLHNIPSTKLQRFIGPITQFVEEIKVSRSMQNVHSPIRLRMDQQREFERQQRMETNQQIIKIFLDLMVDLCGDALKPIYWKVQHQASPTNTLTRSSAGEGKTSNLPQTVTTFSKEKYLLSKSEGVEWDFYKEFVDSAAFQILMDEERTATPPSVFRQVCQVQSLSNEDHIYDINNSLEGVTDGHNESAAMLRDAISSQMLLSLPSWTANASNHYLDSCIDVFTNELENAQQERSPAVISVYAYLRGCALLARGNLMDGLRDLYLIDNPNLFPREFIETTIIPRLSDECSLDLFVHEPFFVDAPKWKRVQTRPSLQLTRISLDGSSNSFEESFSMRSFNELDGKSDTMLGETTLTYEQFSEHIHRLSIVVDNETTETLFNALLYFTDNSMLKTLKKDKTLTNATSKPLEVPTSNNRRQPTPVSSFKDTLAMLNEQRRAGVSVTALPKPSMHTTTTLPTTLFESFLDNWQQTNAEKVRMARCLPEDRQKQESILKISLSDVVSKKDGPGQLLLTPKRLYFLPEARSSARLLTELMHILSVEKYQHQTVFSSSKPAIKILVDFSAASSSLPRETNAPAKSKHSTLEKESKQTISLFFKTKREQELWYTLITELYSGLTIAHEQCDTTVLNQASRNIALMDTLANIDYDEERISSVPESLIGARRKHKQRRNEASLELALNDLSIFTRMRQTDFSQPLPAETRNVLTRRLSPSINETERYPVRCLVFVEHPENGRSSLWCTYGSKLKIFSVSTWICDPTDLHFPSDITCLCLDGRHKLWVGCIQGELFVVDTLTRTCGAQIASIVGEGGCQSIEFDPTRNQILTANQASTVILWNASNWERLGQMNLCEIYQSTHDATPRTFKSEAVVTFRNTGTASTNGKMSQPTPPSETISKPAFSPIDTPIISSASGPAQVTPLPTDKLDRLQIYEDLLFACYRDDYILVLRLSESNTCTYEHLVSVKYKTGDSTPIESFLAYNKQLWISAGCIIYIFNIDSAKSDDSFSLRMKKPVDDDHLITMLGFSGYIWAGSLRGSVYVFRMDNYELYKTFAGHRDSVCCLCPMLDTYVVSGSAQRDTSIAIWENVQATNSGSALTTGSGAKRALPNMNGA